MKIELIAAGTKPPGWVREGFDTYQGRMKGDCELILKEYPVAKRHKTGSIAKYAKEEERAYPRPYSSKSTGHCLR